jgi:hypothetical protein
MSAFIGPIHYWLYEKIRVVSQREACIYEKAVEMCGLKVEEVREQVWQIYGEPLPNDDLSEIIDPNNIHGWLQSQINIAESREAAFIKELLNMCGGTAHDLIERGFSEHGKLCGEKAKALGKYDVSTAPGIYKALNDYYLNGMPCDRADRVVNSQADSILWDIGVCLQEPNWKRVGMDDKMMANFYQAWLKAFVDGINTAFAFRHIFHDRDTGTNRYEICKK